MFAMGFYILILAAISAVIQCENGERIPDGADDRSDAYAGYSTGFHDMISTSEKSGQQNQSFNQIQSDIDVEQQLEGNPPVKDGLKREKRQAALDPTNPASALPQALPPISSIYPFYPLWPSILNPAIPNPLLQAINLNNPFLVPPSVPQYIYSGSLPQPIIPPTHNIPNLFNPNGVSLPQPIIPPTPEDPNLFDPNGVSLPQPIIPPTPEDPNLFILNGVSLPQPIIPPKPEIPNLFNPNGVSLPQPILPPTPEIPNLFNPYGVSLPQPIIPTPMTTTDDNEVKKQ